MTGSDRGNTCHYRDHPLWQVFFPTFNRKKRYWDMFGIGMTELIIILAIALLVIGPDKLPEIARALGKGMAEFKKTADDFRSSIHEDLRAEEEKEKLLKKVQQGKDANPQRTKGVQAQQGEHLQTGAEGEPIADQAPPIASPPEKKADAQPSE